MEVQNPELETELKRNLEHSLDRYGKHLAEEKIQSLHYFCDSGNPWADVHIYPNTEFSDIPPSALHPVLLLSLN